MTKEEILSKFTFYSISELSHDMTSPVLQPVDVLAAMNKYGKQCFEEGIKACIYYYKNTRTSGNYPFDIEKIWNDYLKELENNNII